MVKATVLFLFVVGSGPGPHADVAAVSQTFKTQAACERALATGIETAAERGFEAYGYCTPQKVKAPK